LKLSDIILEQELETKVPEIGNLGAQMAKAVEAELEKEKDDIEEAAGIVGVLGIILLSNTVANMLSKMAQYLAKKFGSEKMMKSASWWEKFTHNNEEAFMSPIKRVVGFFVKDEQKKKAISKILYALVIFSMAGSSGIEAVQYLKQTKWAAGSGYTAKSLIKGVEVNNLIKHAAEDLAG